MIGIEQARTRYLVRVAGFAGNSLVVSVYGGILLAVLNALSAAGVAPFDGFIRAMSPLVLAALAPSIGYVGGVVRNWYRGDDRHDETCLIVSTTLGIVAGTAICGASIAGVLTI